jgi:hypothetical protein
MLEVVVPIALDKQRQMVFDLNAFAAYEEATGKCFLDTVASLFTAVQESAGDAFALMRRISLVDVRALLWAALSQEDPSLTVQQVGKMVNPGNMLDVLAAFLNGHAANLPDASELPEAATPQNAPSTAASGGAVSGQ